MSSAAIFYLSLFILMILGIRIGLYKLFEKAGEPGWKAFVPVYSDVVWVKLIGKPIWWVALTLIPIVRTLVKISMDIELAKAFGKYKFGQQAAAVLVPFIYYPLIGFDKGEPVKEVGKGKRKSRKPAPATGTVYLGPPDTHKNVSEKSGLREWADAFLFAGVAALIIRTFFLEAFMIPTSSMERTLLAGDFLIVSKFHYGSRMPTTPLAIPFVHNKIKIGKLAIPSYTDAITLPYYRLPGFTEVERNDIVVFNYPAHDIDNLDDGAGLVQAMSMKENYIKRCVAVPGDTFEVRDLQIFINGEKGWNPTNKQEEYTVLTGDKPLGVSREKMTELGFRTLDDPNYKEDNPYGATERLIPDMENRNWYQADKGLYTLYSTDEAIQVIRDAPNVSAVNPAFYKSGQPQLDARPTDQGKYAIFPNDARVWPHNRDNYGPIVIPAQGMTVRIDNVKNYLLYYRAITAYEGHELKIVNKKPILDGKPVTTYTFEKDYYFMVGDNRHNSEDSRFWGFVPEDHIVGRPFMVFMSFESGFGIGGFRFDRIGTSVIDEQFK
ncbi:MAG: signal peptidase I [Bacteroidota bacterium]